jgi:hypothetical protein
VQFSDLEHAIKELEKIRLSPATVPAKRVQCEVVYRSVFDALEWRLKQEADVHPEFRLVNKPGTTAATALPGICACVGKEFRPELGAELAAIATESIFAELCQLTAPAPGEKVHIFERNEDGQIISVREMVG